MKVIISGGGTGGHIYPAIALADQIKREDERHEVLFIGAIGKIEMEIVNAAGYPIIGLPIRSLERRKRKFLKNFLLPFLILNSLWKARKIIKNFQPDIIISTGGYASFPTVYTAARQRIPIVIQEQNAYPGITNRILATYASKICVAYEGMDAYFPASKLILTGNPISQSFIQLPSKATAQAYFGLVPGKPTLLVMGGSLGARPITEAILKALPILVSQELQIILCTGKTYFDKIKNKDFSLPCVKIVPYITAMNKALVAADIIVSRAGALAISEISLVQKPVIFIPSPYVTADHQTRNVLPLIEKEAAIMIKEHEVGQQLIPTILSLMQDKDRQRHLANNLQKHAKPEAAAAIFKILNELL